MKVYHVMDGPEEEEGMFFLLVKAQLDANKGTMEPLDDLDLMFSTMEDAVAFKEMSQRQMEPIYIDEQTGEVILEVEEKVE